MTHFPWEIDVEVLAAALDAHTRTHREPCTRDCAPLIAAEYERRQRESYDNGDYK